MRYGGYDLRKATKSKSSSTHSSFRLRKVQNTASNIVGKFNLKISDSIKRLQMQRTTNCESPLSFQGSLFDQQSAAGQRNRSVHYNPEDFRPHLKMANDDQPPSYIFGTNVFNFSARNVLSGKSTIKIINTFREIEQGGDSETDVVSARSSLQRLKDERKTIFKELIELSSCDESLEYRLVKDYLECNSYSEIENDSEFKHYLQRKNYNDILDYLNEGEPQSLTSISSSVARAQSALSKSSTLNNAKVLATPKLLNFAQTSPELYSQLCNACRSAPNKAGPLKWCPNDLNAGTDSPESSNSSRAKSKPNIFANSYREILKYCSEFFEESFGCGSNEKYTLPKFTFSRFSEEKYEQVLKQFVTAQGFMSVADYVEEKFGQFISCELAAFCANEKTSTGQKARTKLDQNVKSLR